MCIPLHRSDISNHRSVKVLYLANCCFTMPFSQNRKKTGSPVLKAVLRVRQPARIPEGWHPLLQPAHVFALISVFEEGEAHVGNPHLGEAVSSLP